MVRLHWNPREWSYAEVILAMVVPGFLYIAFLSIDLLPFNASTVVGQVRSENENWTLKHQYRCYLEIQSETIGHIETFNNGRCHNAFVPGQKITIKVIVGRLTGQTIGIYDSIKKIDEKP